MKFLQRSAVSEIYFSTAPGKSQLIFFQKVVDRVQFKIGYHIRFYSGMNEIAEHHRISTEIQIFPAALKCRKMYHRVGIFMSPESYGFIIISRRKGCMIDGDKRAFYISVFHFQPQMDQRCGVLSFGIIQTAGETVNRVFDIIRLEFFLNICRK